MKNPIRVRYFLWFAALLFGFWLINSLTLLAINFPSIVARGPDWREEFYEWLVITSVGALVLPLLLYVAWRLSRRLLRPLRDMVETSNRIYGGKFNERIHVQDAQDEISELAASLNRALDRYQDVVRRQKQFAGAASHQLRTPLTAIRTTGEIALQHERDAAEYRAAIGRMLEEANRLSHIVEQLLLMTKLSRDESEAAFSAVDAEALLQEVMDNYQPLLHAKHIQATCSGAEGIKLRGQAALLNQALANLVDNAIRHTPPHGAIALTASRLSPSQVEIRVSDSGAGFASPTAERGAGPDSPDVRSGLGLHIVRDIVHAHDGSVHIGVSPLGGARVCVRLPAYAGAGQS